MSSRWRRAALTVAALGAVYAGSARAEMIRSCLPENDAGTGLALAVDDRGVAHLSRLFRVAGDLVYTVLDPLGEPVTMPVAAFISQLAFDEVDQTDLLLVRGVPYVCYYNARADGFEVAHLDDGAWVREQVAEGQRVGDACRLFEEDGRVGTIFRNDGVVSQAVRRGLDDWQVGLVDDGGIDGGYALAISWVDGQLVVAHRDDGTGDLRVSWRQPGGGWLSDVSEQPNPAGVSPQVVGDGAGGVFVMHGVQNPEASDGGLMLTTGTPGDLMTVAFDLEQSGGSNAMLTADDGRIMLATRQKLRSAVFGAQDGLRLYRDLPESGDFGYLERHGSNQRRHEYRHIGLALDPFGNPVLALLIEAAPQAGDPGSGRVCIFREADRDADRLPDVTEARYGSDPDDADTDGDGRIDGDEVLDGFDPAGPGALPAPDPEPDPEPDAAVLDPELDAAIPDPEPDAAVPDPEPDGQFPDSSGPISPDMDPPPDPEPDAGTELDAQPLDAALDSALDSAREPEPDLGLGPDASAEPEPAPDPDSGPGSGDSGPPTPDAGAGGTGASDGCRAAPGGARGGLFGLLLLALGLPRRR